MKTIRMTKLISWLPWALVAVELLLYCPSTRRGSEVLTNEGTPNVVNIRAHFPRPRLQTEHHQEKRKAKHQFIEKSFDLKKKRILFFLNWSCKFCLLLLSQLTSTLLGFCVQQFWEVTYRLKSYVTFYCVVSYFYESCGFLTLSLGLWTTGIKIYVKTYLTSTLCQKKSFLYDWLRVGRLMQLISTD